MPREAVELDFFRMEKESSPPQAPPFERRRSFRDIQGVISKINPEVLKSVIGNCSFPSNASVSVPSTPVQESSVRQGIETAPMTIFYNGTVSVFDVSPEKAQDILMIAEEGTQKPAESSSDSKVIDPSSEQKNFFGTLNGDFPIARRKSLQRFLEKRKERSNTVLPYGCPTKHPNLGHNIFS